ncbi:DUF1249 domain-containing protein [Halochromatium salexigens]|uniref:DUF1249 domain-containing protein n=1 Tax=Halochromatium salexigens TaxID=49447 RepID=A0AAJ0UH69_HALSE|nr:DUF1249 domain-containing protein [Halochromatium salexigens]MBK5930487.1 hypothetical protein [Halochromatium salexigens]
MQAPSLVFSRLDLLAAAPNVGGLMALCEENYAALLRLAPALPRLRGPLRSKPHGHAELLLAVVDQSRYTSTLRLTHLLHADGATGQQPSEPDALLRAYHDAEQVEVLSLRQTVLPVLSHYERPALAAKWRVNLFVSKWLGYCLREGHGFPASASLTAADGRRELLTSP